MKRFRETLSLGITKIAQTFTVCIKLISSEKCLALSLFRESCAKKRSEAYIKVCELVFLVQISENGGE